MRAYEGQGVASTKLIQRRALGAKWIPDGQGCWIAILHTQWPLPDYLHCEGRFWYTLSVSIRCIYRNFCILQIRVIELNSYLLYVALLNGMRGNEHGGKIRGVETGLTVNNDENVE